MSDETPSQQITKPKIVTVTDALGRKIEVRKLKVLDQMRLFDVVGKERSVNEKYMVYAMLAYSVSQIDNDPIPSPTTMIALEMTVQQLDDEGFVAVTRAFSENFLPADRTEDEVRDAIKKG